MTTRDIMGYKKSHTLKVHPQHFKYLNYELDILRKNFKVRIDDRDYDIGDMLILEEYDPQKCEYTGRKVVRQITDILRDNPYVPAGYCILSLY